MSNKKEIILPVSGVTVSVGDLTTELVMGSLVGAFSESGIVAESWNVLNDQEQKTMVYGIVTKSLDTLVEASSFSVSRDTNIKYGRFVLSDAKEAGKKVGLDLEKIIKKDPRLMKRNIFAKVLSDIGDKMFLWAKVIEAVELHTFFGEGESFIGKAIEESLNVYS